MIPCHSKISRSLNMVMVPTGNLFVLTQGLGIFNQYLNWPPSIHTTGLYVDTVSDHINGFLLSVQSYIYAFIIINELSKLKICE